MDLLVTFVFYILPYMPKKILAVLVPILLFPGGNEVRAQAAKGAQMVRAEAALEGSSYAVIVGVSNYTILPKLDYADDDARALRQYLIESESVPADNIFCFIDSTATQQAIVSQMSALVQASKPGDRLFFSFSGHGDWEGSAIREALLLLSNAPDSNYLNAITQYLGCNMLNSMFQTCAEKNVQTILIADACRSGGLAGGVGGMAKTIIELQKDRENCIRLLSCGSNELSKEGPHWGGGRGVFSYYLTLGLKGAACRSPNSPRLTLNELSFYLVTQVSEATGGSQTPTIQGDARAVVARIDPKGGAATGATVAKADAAMGSASQPRGAANSADLSFGLLEAKFRDQVRLNQIAEPPGANAHATYGQMTALKGEVAMAPYRAAIWKIASDNFQSYLTMAATEQGPLAADVQWMYDQLEACRATAASSPEMHNYFKSKVLYLEAVMITSSGSSADGRDVPVETLRTQ